METPLFDAACDHQADKVFAWDMRRRPVRVRRSDDSMLDPDTAIVADCETSEFRALVREYPDRDAAEEIAEAMHARDLEQAAQPPVIEVTVTTPPEGIGRSELAALVNRTVADFAAGNPDVSPYSMPRPRASAATNPFPAMRPVPAQTSRRRLPGKVLRAIRRPRQNRELTPGPEVYPDLPAQVIVPVSEDDTPTMMFPAVREEPAVVEVHLP